MEVKKPQQAATADQTFRSSGCRTLLLMSKVKFKRSLGRVREELITYTKIVVGATFIFGMAIYLLDLIIQGTLDS